MLAAAHDPGTAERALRIRYADVPRPLQEHLADAKIVEETFDSYVAGIEAATARRVADGDREHLIYYALQSRRFTGRARIEPALSARRFVDRLPAAERERLLSDSAYRPSGGLPREERARLTDLLTALRTDSSDLRLSYFRELMRSMWPASGPDGFYPDYLRVVRFLYLKEFVDARDAAAIARLYQTRSHSSDTQIDAGFGVAIGLGVIHALEPAFRARRVLVVGPGLDLAPRTDLIDASPLQSHQPLAVTDALLSSSMASAEDLRVHSVDVNPRVVRAVEQLTRGVTWHLFSSVVETRDRPLSAEYRGYLSRLGRAIGDEIEEPPGVAANYHYQHSIAVPVSVARTFSAESLNVITERLDDAFDVIVATNVLPYFDDREVLLALTNVAAMLRPGGYLVHNESRDGLADVASAVGLPTLQMRTVVLGGPPGRPLYDAVWIHQRR